MHHLNVGAGVGTGIGTERGRIPWLIIALVVLGAAMRVLLLWRGGGTMIDDAYITVRSAQNLIDSGALVYNAGHRVLGVTCPLYALWVSLLLVITPAKLIGYTIGLSNIALSAAGALVLSRLTAEIGSRVSLLIIALFAFHLRFVDNSINGMETSLFMLGTIGAVLLLRERRFVWLSVLLGFLVLVRPEGVLVIAAVLAVVIALRLRPRIVDLLPGIAIMLIWTAWSWLYYGSPVPQSVLSKCGWLVPFTDRTIYGRIPTLFSALSLLEAPQRVGYSRSIEVMIPILAGVSIALFLVGVRDLWRRKSVLLVFPVLFIAYFVFYLTARGRADFSWYGIPSGLAYFVTCVIGLAWLVRRWIGADARRRCFAIALPAIVVAMFAGGCVVWTATRLPYYRMMRTSYESAGEYVDLNCAPDARVLVDELGMIGWSAHRFTDDLGGIVSPEILSYYESTEWQASLSDVLREFRPDVVVICLHASRELHSGTGAEWVTDNYEITAEFPGHVVLEKLDQS